MVAIADLKSAAARNFAIESNCIFACPPRGCKYVCLLLDLGTQFRVLAAGYIRIDTFPSPSRDHVARDYILNTLEKLSVTIRSR